MAVVRVPNSLDSEGLEPYLAQSVLKVVLQKSVSTQIRQLILDISNSKG